MAQPPSEHDEDLGSVDDFAPEKPAVQRRHVELESVVLWLADTWRGSRQVRSAVTGVLALLVVGGVGLLLWMFQPGAASETDAEPIASSRVVDQPIETPFIAPRLPSAAGSERAPSIDREPRTLEKPPSAADSSPSNKSAEAKSPAASIDASQVSPPMPRPVVSVPLPPQASEEEPPPARAEVPEATPVRPAAPAPPRPGSGVTTWGSSRSGVEDPESAAIQEVLGKYRTSFAALDVAAVHQVWPTVNQRSLERAFRQIEGQDVSFFSCTIDVDGSHADAACVGTTNFIPKVGNRSPQSGPSQWNFKLSKRSASGWLIDDAQAR